MHNKFISTFPALEKSDHSESDRKLIRAHWLVGNIGRNSSKHLNIITHAWSEERVKGRVGWGMRGKREKVKKEKMRNKGNVSVSKVKYVVHYS